MNTDFQIIQIGNVLLRGINQTKYARQKKQSSINNSYGDGSYQTNILDLREDIEVEFSCQFTPKNFDDFERLKMTLEKKTILCFFVKMERWDGKTPKTGTYTELTKDGFVPTFYFGYGRCIENIENDYTQSNFEYREIDANLVLDPNLYRCDEYLSFLPKENEQLLPSTFWGGGAVWSITGIVWGQFYSLIKSISALATEELVSLVKCNDCSCIELQNLLFVEDIYVKPNFGYNTSFKLKEASIGAKLKPYTLITFTNTTLNQNLQTQHPLWGIRPQKTVIIQIERKNSAGILLANSLNFGDTFVVRNSENNSGFKLIWKSANPAPQTLQIRFDNSILWNVSTGLVEIPILDYTLESLGNNNEGLFFDGTQITNPVIDVVESANLQTSFSGTLGTDKLEIKINNYLSTY